MKTIFGPVPSRRLGRSLGIDVIPSKTCSYDCIYCESGHTTRLSIRREAFVDPDKIISELEDYFRCNPGGADVLTFSSAGEPTLYEPLGELILSIKRRFQSLPLIVLTNGSLLWDKEVRKSLLSADRVVPSLDAASEAAFLTVNKPHPNLDLGTIIEGLIAFRREYTGEYHLEVLLVSGINDGPEELMRLRKVVGLIDPDRIELNTVVRPPVDRSIRGLSEPEMRRASEAFSPGKIQIIGAYKGSECTGKRDCLDLRIVDLVRRRPLYAE